MANGHVARMGRSDGTVRDVQSGRASLQVPVFSSDPKGDLYEGHIRVPLKWTHTKPFTNERHQFTQYIAEQVKSWVDNHEAGRSFMPRTPKKLNSKPKVQGPFDAPTKNSLAEPPDWAIYTVTAHFLPMVMTTIGLDDAYELEMRARRYGVDVNKPKPVSTPIETGKDVIVDHTPFGDPMQMAEERRQQFGLKREELLIGNLSDPWPERQ